MRAWSDEQRRERVMLRLYRDKAKPPAAPCKILKATIRKPRAGG